MSLSQTPPLPPTSQTISGVSEVEIQASDIVERLEEAVEKATEAVAILEQSDETNPEFKESNLGLKGQTWKANQGFLQSKARATSQILSLLEDVVVYENGGGSAEDDEGPTVTSLTPLSPLAKTSLALQGVAGFANTLDRPHLHNINSRVHNDTTRWLTHLFRLYESSAFYHDEPLEGLVRVGRMLLHYKYPRYLEDGFEALTARSPTIYTSSVSSFVLVQHLCRQLGLALSCVRAVPVCRDNPQVMDVTAMEKLIEEDKALGREPLLILADAGTPLTGHVDDLLRLQELSRNNDIWLHVRGHNLATLAMINSTTVPTRLADSVTLSLGTWLGVPGLAVVTLYRQLSGDRSSRTVGTARESTLPLVAGLVTDHLHKKLVALPVWFALQALGREGIQRRIKEAFELAEELWMRVVKHSCLRLLSQRPGGQNMAFTVQHLIEKPVTTPTLMFEVTASTVVFQFVPEGIEIGAKVPSYYDRLNSWLGQILQRDCPQLEVELCEVENSGLVLRLCPLEAILPITATDIETFTCCLQQQLDILLATVRLKVTFQQQVAASPRLQLVEMEGWAGLGGVRYIPSAVEPIETDQSKQELNKLNIELVSKLRSTDAAFSLGEGVDGLVCVRFGMVTSDTDVEELLSLVIAIGAEVEDSYKYLDTMVEIVKKGIETATIDLQKENEDRLWQDGILRQVPVFGSIVNWWSPKSKESGVKGRSLNLQAGVVESTENIYRYHMQLQQGQGQGAVKSPPQPLVQTPVLPDASSRHSRSSSHSSQRSADQPAALQASPSPS